MSPSAQSLFLHVFASAVLSVGSPWHFFNMFRRASLSWRSRAAHRRVSSTDTSSDTGEIFAEIYRRDSYFLNGYFERYRRYIRRDESAIHLGDSSRRFISAMHLGDSSRRFISAIYLGDDWTGRRRARQSSSAATSSTGDATCQSPRPRGAPPIHVSIPPVHVAPLQSTCQSLPSTWRPSNPRVTRCSPRVTTPFPRVTRSFSTCHAILFHMSHDPFHVSQVGSVEEGAEGPRDRLGGSPRQVPTAHPVSPRASSFTRATEYLQHTR